MPEPRLPRILIGDDHALVAQAIQHMLAPHFDVIAVVGDGRQLVESAEALHPDVVLVDVAMPRLNGLDAAQRIHESLPDVQIIYLSMNCDPAIEAEAMKRGACAFLPKTIGLRELCEAVNAAIARRPQSPVCNTAEVRVERCELTSRQRDVLQLLAEGLSMKQVGDVLHLATRTVAFHKYRIMDLLGLKNDSEMFQYAITNRIIFLDGTRGAPDRTVVGASDIQLPPGHDKVA